MNPFSRLFSFAILFTVTWTAHAQFADPTDLTDPRGAIRDIEVADMNNDGAVDIISAQDDFNDDYGIDWYANDGSGNWIERHTVDHTINGSWDIEIADIDGDGDPDVLGSFPGANTIAWFANDGSGSFSSPNIIVDTLSGCRNAHPVDIDGDGDIDVLSVNDEVGIFDNWSKVVLYRNLGSGVFGPVETINGEDIQDPYDVTAADVDGDTDLDVVCAALNTDDIVWYENLGGGLSFGPKTSMANTLIGCRDIEAADLDDDGDMDFTVAGVGDDRAVWLENNGSSNFTVHRLSNPESSVDDCMDLTIFDADQDGDLDIAAAMFDENDIKIYRNTGLGSFGSFELISDRIFGAYSVAAADFDGDGTTDLASGSDIDGKIAWYVNAGSGIYGVDLPVNRITASVSSFAVTDVDIDGDPDLVVTSSLDDKLSWFENLGNSFGMQQYIDLDVFEATEVVAAHMNADAMEDLVVISDDVLSLYLNTGSGYTKSVISTLLDDGKGVIAIDVDGDTDLDVVTTSWFDSKLAWYENLGGGIFGPQIFLKTVGGADALTSADFDNDGDPDLIVGNEFSDRILLFENLGGGIFDDMVELIGSMNGTVDADVADLDGDGDMDIMAVGFYAGTLSWVENLGGLTFGPEIVLASSLSLPGSVQAWDPDGDGDKDLLVAIRGENKFVSVENLGSGVFGAGTTLDNPFEYPATTAVADFDNDGDEDMVGGFSNTTYLIENLRINDCSTTAAPTGLSSTVSGDAFLSWNAVPGSVGCQVLGRPLGAPSFSGLAPVIGFEVNSTVIPESLLTPGQTYEWKLRCACVISPLSVTPLSDPEFFTVPLIRLPAQGEWTLFPNPATDLVNVGQLEKHQQVQILDLQGRFVLEGAPGQAVLNLGDLGRGVYNVFVYDPLNGIQYPINKLAVQ